MTQIRIDTQHVREAGQRFIDESKRLTEVGHQLQNAASGLDLWAWDGHSRRQADSLLGRMRPENAYLAAKLESMGHRLLLVADVFEQRDREAESDFDKIPWVDFETAHRLNITPRTNLNPVAGTMLCAATLSELPMTGESSGGLVEAIYRIVPIEAKVTQLDELDKEIKQLQQRLDNLTAPKSGLELVLWAILSILLQRKTILHDVLIEAIVADPTPLTVPVHELQPVPGGEKGHCLGYAKRRRPDLEPSNTLSDACQLVEEYRDVTFHPPIMQPGEDLRLNSIRPGMAIVWDRKYQDRRVNDSRQGWPLGNGGYAHPSIGHVAIVESVQSDGLWLDDGGAPWFLPWAGMSQAEVNEHTYVIP